LQEIRLHGRGGQGAVVAAEMLATAFVKGGKYASSFPMFGFERRGAPVMSFVRVDDARIRERTQIYSPDCVIVLDPLLKNSPAVFVGLKKGGTVILNADRLSEREKYAGLEAVGIVDATKIALEEIAIPVTNTVILGAFAAVTGWLTLDSVLLAIKEYFSEKLLEKNIRCAQRGFAEAKVYAS